LAKGLVIKSTGSWYRVISEGKMWDCKIKGKFRMKGIRSTNPIAVGDLVEFKPEDETTAVIQKIEQRKNYIIRRSSNLSKESHIIAANVDQAVLIVTANFPETLSSFIDRFLVSAEAYKIPVCIVVNKMDLYSEKELAIVNRWEEVYTEVGYGFLKVSAEKDENVDAFAELLNGKISVLAGNSGVGKSTLVNSIAPGLDLKTASISDYHKKGQHTTTFAEMFPLDDEGWIIDTPGVKAFGLLDVHREELHHYFPEMFRLLEDCQFGNCTHTHEPKCAVKEAVAEGEIAEERYLNYIAMLDDENEKHRKPF